MMYGEYLLWPSLDYLGFRVWGLGIMDSKGHGLRCVGFRVREV